MLGRVLPVLLALVFAGCATAPNAPDRPPNFIVIFIDDMGYGDIGPYGNTVNRTPHLDRMAAEGMKLTSFYAAPVCTPSRAALVTGSYPPRVGLGQGSWHAVLMPGDEHGLHPDEVTIAEVLKQAGYATACIGKWHLGDQPEFLPTRQGFDYYYGLPFSNDMTPDVPFTPNRNFPPLPLLRNEEVIEEVTNQNHLTASYTEEAVRFIRDNAGGPFFVYMPHTMVHVPLHASDKFREKSSNGILGDAIEELDWSVGQVLDTVRELGLRENTLVVFTSDNGPARGSAGPLRGRKGSTYEGGMREPTIAWWPGAVPANSSSDEIASVMDLLPTFAALAGTVPQNAVDGHDLSAILKGDPDAKSGHEAFFYYSRNNLRAVRAGPWKLHSSGELYNLTTDIGESTNIAAQHPDIVASLTTHLDRARADLGDGDDHPGANTRPPGKVADPRFLIPRHTGEPHAPVFRGPIKRSPDFVRPKHW